MKDIKWNFWSELLFSCTFYSYGQHNNDNSQCQSEIIDSYLQMMLNAVLMRFSLLFFHYILFMMMTLKQRVETMVGEYFLEEGERKNCSWDYLNIF